MDRRKALKNTALLLGVTASSSTIVTLLQSCQEQNRLDWQPKFFSVEQAEIVSEIAETILPKTETVGAKDLKVDMFVDLMIKETLSQEDQQLVLDGMVEFNGLCQDMFGKSYPKLSIDERHKVLAKSEADSNTFNTKIWGGAVGVQAPIGFYRRVKQLTLVGYYTSQDAGKAVEEMV